jgi:DNA-binding NarL/FixJ family response regulator
LGASVLDRAAYRLLLRQELDVEIVAEADFAPTSVWSAMREQPAVAIVDADQATPAALDAVQMITRLRPGTRVLVVGAAVDPAHIQAWSRCTIHGYVVKDGGLEELRQALRAVADNRQYFSEGVRNAVRRPASATSNGRLVLSRRESELLPLLARGMTLREAAQRMAVSYKTADSYRTSLLRKLGLRDRVDLARYAIRERIVDP